MNNNSQINLPLAWLASQSKRRTSQRLKVISAGLISALVVFGLALQSHAQTKYSVYCASGKIEVDMRSFEEMKSARGSDTCKLAEFNYLSDANSFAQKNFGGVGAKCSCK